MAVLTKKELIALAQNQTTKLLGDDYKLENFEPSSYDLRVGTAFKDEKIYRYNSEKKGFTNVIVIKPSEIVTFLSWETVTIPADCTGTVFAINKQSSKGLLILNPGHIDPGFSGPISVCAMNLSKEEIRVGIGDKIFTLILQKLTQTLSENDLYKNKPGDRKVKEEEFNKNTALQLSRSFFDLISTYKSSPYFKDQVIEVIKGQLRKAYGIVSAIVIAIIGLFIFLVKYDVISVSNPFKWPEEKKELITKYDSINKVTFQEIKKLKEDNKSINDSIIVLRKKIK